MTLPGVSILGGLCKNMTKSTFVYGIHAVEALLQLNSGKIQQLFLQKGSKNPRIIQIKQMAQHQNLVLKEVDAATLQSLAPDMTHQGIMAECETLTPYDEHDLAEYIEKISTTPFLLILDQVQDPHNLGACLRTADAVGVDAVIVPKDQSAAITPTVRKVACGAAETVPFFQVTNLARTIRMLKEAGIWIYGLAGEAEQDLYQTDLKGPIALVLGGEGKGLRRLTRELCDYLLFIPMFGSVASLNVSVATAICLYEAKRQRNVLNS